MPSGCQDRMNVGAAAWGPSTMAPLGLSQPPSHYLPETTCASRPRALCTGNGSQGPASQALSLTGMRGPVGLGSLPWGTEELHGSRVQGPESTGWGRGGHRRQGSSFIQRPASQGARSLVPVSVEPQPQAGAGSRVLSDLPPASASCVQSPARSGLASLVEWCRPL